ncbi:MAG: acyl-CoA dehydrogenase family protein, partial [Deltaproteobacteria bacterium]|nr:acyl-CoA dehydrogenase family protein [Deltaproteobacteria bacterium]
MDLNFAEEYEEYRHKLQEFLKGWPLQGEEADLPLADQQQLFRQRGIEAGYVYFDIPKEYGGAGQEPDVFKSAIIADEYASSGAPGNGVDQGPGLLAPTLIEFGTEEQKRQFVLPTL